MAFNLAASWFRRRAAEARARQRSQPVAPALPDHTMALAVRRAVAALPLRRRTALLRYYLDLSVDETAEVMGCRPGTVKALCAQAAAALRDHPLLADVEVHG